MTWRTFTLSGVTVSPTRTRKPAEVQDGRCYTVARWTEGDARPSRSLGWCTLDEARAEAARIATRAPDRPATVAALLDVWIAAQEERLEAGEIRPETLRSYNRDRRTLATLCGKLDPSTVTAATLADLATRIARLGTLAATTLWMHHRIPSRGLVGNHVGIKRHEIARTADLDEQGMRDHYIRFF
jgi:hypothetical protein